jgi:hypothetical protein
MKKLLIFLVALSLGIASQGQYMNKWYGVKYTVTATAPEVTRIAEDDDLTIHHHDNLPIQNLMVGCLLKDNGTVNYYLNPTDWTLKAGGGASNLDGTDGQVMVEIPAHYESFTVSADTNFIKVSLTYKAGFRYVPKMYVSAYKAALNRTTLKLSSVINTSAAYYGADNSSTYAGYPATYISRTNFRTYAQNRGANWSMQSYQAWKTVYWLYVIEYANRNCQAAVGSPDGSGYQTGGLGNGVTTLTHWDQNGYRPTVPCGTSNSLGNFSGEVDWTTTVLTDDENVKVPRYRGIESPFGDIWEWMDGISIYHSVSPRASYSYIIDNPNYFSDGAVNLGRARAVMSLCLSSGYVQTIVFGSHGDPLPSAIGGGATTYWCDYFYTPQNVGTAGWYAPIVGGNAPNGAYAGFGSVSSNNGASDSASYFGSRLCFLGS